MAIFRDHPALLITLFALLFSVLGMFSEFMVLREFGVNYFDYADLDDFIIGSGKILNALSGNWLAALGVLSAYLIIIFVFIMKKASDNVGDRTENFISINQFVYTSVGFIVLLSTVVFMINKYFVIDGIKSGENRHIEVKFKEGGRLPSSGNLLQMITGTNNAFFYYEISGSGSSNSLSKNKVHIVPVQNVLHQYFDEH